MQSLCSSTRIQIFTPHISEMTPHMETLILADLTAGFITSCSAENSWPSLRYSTSPTLLKAPACSLNSERETSSGSSPSCMGTIFVIDRNKQSPARNRRVLTSQACPGCSAPGTTPKPAIHRASVHHSYKLHAHCMQALALQALALNIGCRDPSMLSTHRNDIVSPITGVPICIPLKQMKIVEIRP